MTPDSSNPFAKLTGKFPDKAGKARSGDTVTRSSSTRGRTAGLASGKQKSVLPANAATDEDAALFLDAVRFIKPLSGKPADDHAAPLAEALSAALGEPSPQPQKPPEARAKPAAQKRPEKNATSRQDRPEQSAAGSAAAPSAASRAPASDATDTSMEQSFAEFMAASGMSALSTAPASPAAPTLNEDADAAAVAFAEAMRGVAPVHGKGRVIAPEVKQNNTAPAAADPNLALRELLEGRVEFALHHSDEYMEGCVTGLDPMVMGRLRAGQLSPEAHIDLHGQNSRQAFEGLTWFMKNAYQRNLRTVIIVTGRGKNSPGGQGVLRPLLAEWLSREPFKRVVLAFCTAKPSDGGPGAVYVLLRKYKKSRGKIVWEQYLPDGDTQE